MKTLVISLLTFAAIVTTQSAKAELSMPQQEMPPEAVSLFYADLSPYGEWIELESGFYAWHPTIYDSGWRPYMRGHWVWSNYGWYWVSAEPFGWATYHYGRWYFDDAYGWIWIPDTIWGPAWVEWRYNDDYIGWAPLPPYARFHITVGIRFTRRWSAPPTYWSFIAYRHFGVAHPYRDYTNESYTRRLIGTTRSAGRYQVDENRIIDQGVERSFVERRGSTRIGTYDVTEVPQRGVDRVTTSGSSERIEVYRPRPGDNHIIPGRFVTRRAETRSSLDFDRVERPRTIPQRGEQNRLTAPGKNTEEQGKRVQPQNRTSRGERPDVRRDNFMRTRPQFPAPKFENKPRKDPGTARGGNRGGRRRGEF